MKQQLTSFSEEKADEVRSVGTPFQQAGFQAAPLQENSSLFNQKQENSISSSIVNNQQNSFSSQQQMSSSSSVQKSQQITSQSSSSSSKSFSSMQSSNMVQKVRRKVLITRYISNGLHSPIASLCSGMHLCHACLLNIYKNF